MRTSKYIFIFTVFAFILLMTDSGCKKDEEPNPYLSVDYDTDTTTTVTPDPNSITGLHKNIFLPTCAKSGCHDGTFEPDFRTVESSYATLVYHPVIKTTADSVTFYELRVKPYEVNSSFLHERITTLTADYMPSNSLTRLTSQEIAHIDNWIMNGARDEAGNIPVAPDLPPTINYYFVLDSVYRDIDTIRVNGLASPIHFQPGQTAYFYYLISDDSTQISQLQVNQMKISTLKDDFTSAAVYTGTFFQAGTYEFWRVIIPTSAFPLNTQLFFRYYVNDGHQVSNTESPRNDYPDYYKQVYSFIIY